MSHPPEPTSEQCEQRARVEHEGRVYHACWYPQMGGYGSKCLVEKGESQDEDGCFEAWVWHDGEFPFSAGDAHPHGPARLHHCSAEQFVEFGQWVTSLPATRRDR